MLVVLCCVRPHATGANGESESEGGRCGGGLGRADWMVGFR